jgi:hypothetical protein
MFWRSQVDQFVCLFFLWLAASSMYIPCTHVATYKGPLKKPDNILLVKTTDRCIYVYMDLGASARLFPSSNWLFPGPHFSYTRAPCILQTCYIFFLRSWYVTSKLNHMHIVVLKLWDTGLIIPWTGRFSVRKKSVRFTGGTGRFTEASKL